MICVLTHRRLKPGAWEGFRAGWEPEEWWGPLARAYHLRSYEVIDEIDRR